MTQAEQHESGEDATSERQAQLAVIRKLGDFEIVRRLGAGGMAEVFLAKRRGAEATYKLLVVKRILPKHISSDNFRAMFAEEARLAARLNHPNIVQVYDFQDAGESGQLLSMEYVEGPDLGKVARSARAAGKRLPPYVAAFIISEAARGLHYAHERKDERGSPLDIVHRDVSPQNILISVDGVVKIADFGIASANILREARGTLKGKVGYMSPQQARGERVDRRSDIYSLGIVMHELLTGRPLFPREEGKEQLERVRNGTVEAPSVFVRGVPGKLESIAMRALSREPEDRFQTARDFANAITRSLLEMQMLIDSESVGEVIQELVEPEPDRPDTESPHSAPAEQEPGSVTGDEGGGDYMHGEAHPLERKRLQARAGREVRHVAIVSLVIQRIDEVREAVGEPRTERLMHRLRQTLGEIAFKRTAAWYWEKRDSETGTVSVAQAVVGLMANPTAAAANASW